MTDPKEKNKMNAPEKNISLLNEEDNNYIEEIDSDGSASAFEETERVEEDNFDDLREK